MMWPLSECFGVVGEGEGKSKMHSNGQYGYDRKHGNTEWVLSV